MKMLCWAAAAAFALAASSATSASATDAVSQLTVPITGQVFDRQTGEHVVLEGRLHLVLRVDGGESALHLNVAGGSGVGETTGANYSFTGADKVIKPDGPPIRLSVHFRLGPEGPPISPEPSRGPIAISAQLFLGYGGGGELTGATLDFSGAHD